MTSFKWKLDEGGGVGRGGEGRIGRMSPGDKKGLLTPH